MSESIVMTNPAVLDLEPSPIPANWILNGMPEAWSKNLARSRDWTSQIVVWECTPGHFTWHYSRDESVVVLSGEAFLVRENGEERRFGAGDLGFFPAGTTCTWRVTENFRKVAIMRETVGRPLGLGVKIWKKITRAVGVGK
jgi:uncharacterized cupin superfamily protein